MTSLGVELARVWEKIYISKGKTLQWQVFKVTVLRKERRGPKLERTRSEFCQVEVGILLVTITVEILKKILERYKLLILIHKPIRCSHFHPMLWQKLQCAGTLPTFM